ncbi:hypothetical protein ACOME3_003921 [Neoechinorhynchus agilis]
MACYIGRDDLVSLLLRHKASPNLLNLFGWTPLQMAVIGNNPSIISILHEDAKVNIDDRNSLNLFTGLHCAAACNNVQALKTLLSLGANPLCLSDDGKTPLQIAHEYKSTQCINELSAQNREPAKTNRFYWYHGETSEEEQASIEAKYRGMNGAFYVRKSRSNSHNYTVCVWSNGDWVRFRITQREDGLYENDGGEAFYSLEHAIDDFTETFGLRVHPICAQVIDGNPTTLTDNQRKSDFQSRKKLEITRRVPNNTVATAAVSSKNRLSSPSELRATTSINRQASSSGEPKELPLVSNGIQPPPVKSAKPRSSTSMTPRLRSINVKTHSGSTNNLSSGLRLLPVNSSGSTLTQKSDGTRPHRLNSSAMNLSSRTSHHAGQRPQSTSFANFLSNLGSSRQQQNGHNKRQLFDTLNLKRLLTDFGFNSLRSKSSMIPRIDSTQIKFGHMLGQGNFGKVYSGYYIDESFMKHPVAVKVLRDGVAKSQKREFIQEASVMQQLIHPFIVRLYGIVTDGNNLWMVQELIPLGSLIDRLTKPHSRPNQLKTWIIQICSGMQFMEASRYVHRDLAARNILLASEDRIKISDFGLSRYTGNSSSNEYVQQSDCPIPFQWYAPESFAHFHFTNKSDVWSFGIVIWEMFTNCQFPYEHVAQEPTQLFHFLQNGGRLGRPSTCSPTTWSIVMDCWKLNPNSRPSFKQLMSKFSALSEYGPSFTAVNRWLRWHD